VTGGAGFIGSHLCDALSGAGHELAILDNFSSGKRENLAALQGRVEIVEGDVASGGLDRVQGQFDAIIHLAALISGYDSLLDPDAYVTANISGVLRVIDFAAARKVGRIVFASSSTVYGDTGMQEINEDIVPRPVTVYAASKLAGEHLLSMYGRMHGFSHCSLRFFNVYGPRQAVDHPYANVTCKFSFAAANSTPIKLYGDGDQTRDFVFVDDVVRALQLVLMDSPSICYNIGTGTETSINDLIGTLQDLTGGELQISKEAPWPMTSAAWPQTWTLLSVNSASSPLSALPKGSAERLRPSGHNDSGDPSND
jgi:UDP-glucose 4-epimerase